MNTPQWISRSVSRLLPSGSLEKNEALALVESTHDAIKSGVNQGKADSEVSPRARSTQERLKATLSQKDEALSPRVLRRTLQELQAIIDPRVSEVEGGRRAKAIATSA